MIINSLFVTRLASAYRGRLALMAVLLGVLSVSAQLSVNVRPDGTTLNTPGIFSTFEIDYRWASTSLDVAGAKIEISLAGANLDNDAAADVVLGRTAHVATAVYSTTTKKVTFTFVNPLPAGSTGTLSLQTRFRADGTITNGVTRPITAVFTATGQPTVSDTSTMVATGILPTKATLTKIRSLGGTTNELVRYTIAAQVPQVLSMDVYPFVLVDRLPVGATFVAASSSGVYSPGTHTVTWPVRTLEAGAAAVSYTVDVRYLSSSGFTVGTTVRNIAESTNTPLYGTSFVMAATNDYILVAPSIGITQQRKLDAGFLPIFNDSFTWEVEFRHNGTAMAQTATVEDTFPPEFYPTAFNPGYALVNPTVVWMYYRTKNAPLTWIQVGSGPVSVTSSTDATGKSVSVTSLGLLPGDVVAGYRWVYTNFNPVADCRATGSTGPTTTGYIGPVDRDGKAVSPTATVLNNASITMTRTGSIPVTLNVNDTVQLAQPRPSVDLTKALNPTGQIGLPGTTNTWRLTVLNNAAATTNLVNPVIADLIPASLEYVTGSATRGAVGFTNAVITATPNYQGTGRTLLRVAFQGRLGINVSATIDFKTVVRGNTVGGTVQNAFSFLSSDNIGTVFVDAAVSDTNDLDGDGNTTEKFSTTTANLTVNTTAAVSSRKAVQGYPDAAFYTEGASYVGGPMAYRLRVQNLGNVALTNIVVVDILPYVGDTGVIVTNELRGSQWAPVLTGPVSGPAGVTVYYSLSTNPYRPELLTGGPPGAINDWSSVPPDDLRSVKALKFAFNERALNAADTVELAWPMQIPLNAPTNTYAVNSFGFVATRKDNGERLFPSEPLSVRIKAGPPMPVNIGDLVWNDANTNGVQDVGEVGLNGVRVELYRDGGDGQAGSTDDTFVTFVLTGINTNGASGFYQFSHQQPGNYFVRVIPAVGYSHSPANQGANDALDSDINPASGYTALLVTYSGDRIWTLDAGLYFTGYGTIGNYIWNDRNGDGIQNEGSVDGLNGVRVELFAVGGSSSNLVATQTSAYDSFGNPGYYLFDYVSPSNYVMHFVAPSNFTFTTRGAVGTPDATDSDPDPATGFTELFTVGIGSSDLSWDAGLLPQSGALSIGNMVWFDADGDRIYDRLSGEEGINNVSLSLFRDVNDDNILAEGVDPLYGSTVTATVGGEKGRYLFSGLPAGKYFVTVDSIAFAEGKALAGLTSTPGQQNADNDVDHDDNGAPASNRVVSTRITLAAGSEPAYGIDTGEDDSKDSNLTLDFGFLYATNLVAVGGTLFLDANNDGLQGVAEPVFTIDQLVELWSPGADNSKGGGDDTFVASMFTDGIGTYLFDELAPGRYYIIIPTPPASASSATVLAVDADNGQDADSNALQPGSAGAAVYSPVFQLTPHLEPAGAAESGPGGTADDALACGDSNADMTQDFGFVDLAPVWSIRGQVRDDYDLDGSFADLDRPVGGVIVQLYSDPNGDGNPADGAQLASTITQANGTYAFTDLPNGLYVIVEIDPPGSSSTADTYGANDNRIAVTVNNFDLAGNDFLDAFHPQGYFYHVLDGAIITNGSVSVTGPGVVTLRMDGSSGQYSFVTDGTLGIYTLVVTPPPGYLIDPSRPPAAALFDPAGGPDPTRLGTGESTVTQGYLLNSTAASNSYYYAFVLSADRPVILNNNFPLMRPNRLGDRVWHDLNGNGAQDIDEPGLSNVTVHLLDIDQNVVTSAVSDAQGFYAFYNPGTAGRSVYVVAPTGYSFTVMDSAAANDTTDSDVAPTTGRSAVVTVASGSTNLTVDAGLYVPAKLDGYLFKDKNNDQIRNTGDTTITNALVSLIVNGKIFASINTDTNGYYSFAGVPPGVVTVQVVQANATLVKIPEGSDPMRNRAVINGIDTAVIVYTVVSGYGVLPESPSQTYNFGYSQHPLSTQLDFRVYTATNGRVMIEISTVNENGNYPIEVYAKIDGVWALVATVPADQIVGFGSNTYIVEALGLTPGESYEFKIIDESGHIFESGLIEVARTLVGVEAMTLTPEMIAISFKTTPDLRYQVMVCEALGALWMAEYVQYPTARGWSKLSNQPFTAGPGAKTEVLVPRNNRAKAFFKIMTVKF